jgi:nucleoside-diphosphate-sugar epimerase
MPATPFPYVETKRRGEEIALATEGVEVVVVRPGNVYGPRDRITMLPMIRAMESGLMGVIDGGRYLTCPSYVENLVDGIQRAMAEPRAAGRAYLLTDGLEVTWRDWIDALAAALSLARPRLSVPKRLATRAAMACEGVFRGLSIRAAPPLTLYRVANGGNDYHFSIGRARRELGHEPAVGLREACERTAAWYREEVA